MIGNYLHYDTCPNCGDSWWWKLAGGIAFKSEGSNLYEIMICKECLRDPARLSLMRIEKYLVKSGWEETDIRLAGIAIINYKVKKTKLIS